jgi:CDP-diacylglycerol--glycerol-3-phosphate 3-phosphatidyltransferase
VRLREPWNVALALTCARILVIPGLMVLLLTPVDGGRWWAVGLYLAAALTDSVDGWLARSRGQVTVAGAFLDPLADKLLVSAALVSLIEIGEMPAWAAMVIIAREFAVTGLRLIAASQDIVIAASQWGKIKTTTQVAAIIALIVDDPPHTVTTVLVAVAVAATIWSGVEYFIAARDVLKAPA